MAKLDDIKSGSRISGIVANQPVELVSVEWIGQQAINVVYRFPAAGIAETTLYRDDEARLAVEQTGRSWSFDADGALLRLVTEANRMKLAHHFDPYLAIHTRIVDQRSYSNSTAARSTLSFRSI